MALTPDLKRTNFAPLFETLAVWLAGQLVLQKQQLFLWVPVIFALGIGFYFLLPSEPPLVLGMLVTAIFAVAVFLTSPSREKSATMQGLWLVLCGGLLISGGSLAATYRTQSIAAPMITKKLGPVSVEGTVSSTEDLGEGETGMRILLSHLTIERLAPDETPRTVRLKLRKSANVKVGQRIRVLAMLNPPSDPSIPGGFDFQRYAFFKGIGAVGFIYNEPEILQEPKTYGFYGLVERLRQNVAERIELATHYPEAGIITALVTGKRAAISEGDYQAIRDAGLAHMLAISGLHVGLFSTVFFFFCRLIMAAIPGFALNHPIKKYAAVIGMAAAIFYMLLAGSTIPAQRAAMMSGIVFLAVILDRSPLSLRLVAFAAFTVLVFSPESLTSASFQMSFAAVTALVVFFDAIREQWSNWYSGSGLLRRGALYFLGVCLTTVIATCATAPFALFHFQQLGLYALLSNFVAVPLLAFVIMPFAVLALIIMPLGFEAFPLAAVSWGVNGVLEIAHWTAEMEGAVLHVTLWPLSGLVMIVIAAIILMLVRGPLKFAALLPFTAAVILIAAYCPPDILISGNQELIGYSEAPGHLSISTKRRERFTAENWERAYGLEEGSAKKWPNEGQTAFGMICAEEGCRLQRGPFKIAFSRSVYSHDEDCVWADILIAPDPVEKQNCASPVIIDKFDTWKFGAHGIWLEEGNKSVIKRVEDLRGNRPWTQR